MYINYPHFFIPKFCGILSFIVNPYFIYILLTDKKLMFGNYRFLLISFAMFNMLCSMIDAFVPMCVHNVRYAFIVFISEGPFFDFSQFGQLALSVRCGFITVTYAILHAHFIYRYLVLFRNEVINRFFLPYGLILTFVYCFLHMLSWTAVCEFLFYSDKERRTYVRKSFEKFYDIDANNLNMVIAQYSEGSREAVLRSWIGLVFVTCTSVFSMALYFALGNKIVQRLRSRIASASSSDKTLQMQRQLFKALAVQTLIPMCVSLLPCLAVWFAPIFLLNCRWLYLTGVIAVSIFPCLDPIVVIFFLPRLQRRLGFKRVVSSRAT